MKIRVNRHKREAGQANLLIVLALGLFLLGAVGLGVDVSHLYAQRQMAQAAADAGAQAGLMSFYRGTYTTSTFSSGDACTSTALTPCSYAASDGFTTSNGDVLSVTYGNNTSAAAPAGVTLPPSSTFPVSWVTMSIRRSVPTTLMRVLGVNTGSAGVTATAALATTSPNCVTTLSTSGTGLQLGGSADLELGTCGIQVNSNMTVNGAKVQVQAGSIQVNGSFPTGDSNIQPQPTSGPQVNDPYAYLQAPAIDTTCNGGANTNVKVTKDTTLSPGTYCGGITVSNGSVTFNSGTYVLLGGGFKITGGNLTGNGVTFYNTFNATYAYGTVDMSGNGNETLSAPSSGPYQGVLFFEDRNAPSGNSETFNGTTGQSFTGALYFPNNTVKYVGNDTTTQNLAIVSKYASFSGNASLTVDPSAASGGPVAFKVALVQ